MADRKQYGDPIVALRLPSPMIAAAKVAARKHGTTFSGLMRDLITQQLLADGIDWNVPSKPIQGQKSIDDYLVEEATNA